MTFHSPKWNFRGFLLVLYLAGGSLFILGLQLAPIVKSIWASLFGSL